MMTIDQKARLRRYLWYVTAGVYTLTIFCLTILVAGLILGG